MIDEADFQKVGNAAIDLCVFVDKLRLGEKHREEVDKLTHNVLNLIKQTGKIKEEPLTKGNKMKKLKIQFWKAEKALAMQVLEQEGLPKEKEKGYIRIVLQPELLAETLYLRGKEHEYNLCILSIDFNNNSDRDAYLEKAVNAITDELFTGEGELKIGEMCEVKDYKDGQWKKRKLLAILPKEYKNPFVAESEVGKNDYCILWNCARPITKRIKPTVEKCGNVVTYTWEEK